MDIDQILDQENVDGADVVRMLSRIYDELEAFQKDHPNCFEALRLQNVLDKLNASYFVLEWDDLAQDND